MNPTEIIQAELGSASQMVRAGNYPQAELHLRRYLRSGGAMRQAQDLLHTVTRAYGMEENFRLSETRAVARPGLSLIHI